jgi:hypothetical protein
MFTGTSYHIYFRALPSKTQIQTIGHNHLEDGAQSLSFGETRCRREYFMCVVGYVNLLHL